jgi:hypothetical protein
MMKRAIIAVLIAAPLLIAAGTLIDWNRIQGSVFSSIACFDAAGAASYCSVDPTTMTFTGGVIAAKPQASAAKPLVNKVTASIPTNSVTMPAGCVVPQVLDVYVDGVLLSPTDDYTTVNGSGSTPGTVNFLSPLGSGFTDIVQMRCWI